MGMTPLTENVRALAHNLWHEVMVDLLTLGVALIKAVPRRASFSLSPASDNSFLRLALMGRTHQNFRLHLSEKPFTCCGLCRAFTQSEIPFNIFVESFGYIKNGFNELGRVRWLYVRFAEL